jgi:hypothetical protein
MMDGLSLALGEQRNVTFTLVSLPRLASVSAHALVNVTSGWNYDIRATR